MNTLLYERSDITPSGQLLLTDARLQHLIKVLGVKLNDSIRVGEIGGKLGRATITYISEQQALLDVTINDSPPAKLPLTLVLALPRPKMLRRIIRAIAELGVADLHLINSYRVEKSYWHTPVLAPTRTRELLVQGLAQSCDTALPSIYLHKRFKPFAEDTLPNLAREKRAMVAHPGNYPACPRGLNEEVILVIGPEGGFIPYEIEKLEEMGCQIVSLGKRILRVETAVNSVIGRLF